MKLKSYDKAWLPALKGALLILFGLFSILWIFNTVKTLAVLFVALIGMMAFLLIGTGVMFKKSKFRAWTFAMGMINLAFAINLAIHLEDHARVILWIILFWIVFYGICELVEAAILISLKNAFFALYLLNACLTLLFGYFLLQLKGNFTERTVFFVGLIALVFGIANTLSAYLLGRIKEDE
jgi:uncharacterized membrane protein HdeD (DUF308 family)